MHIKHGMPEKMSCWSPSDKPENGIVTRVTFEKRILKLFARSAKTIGTDSGEAMKSGRHNCRCRKIMLGRLRITQYMWHFITGSRCIKDIEPLLVAEDVRQGWGSWPCKTTWVNHPQSDFRRKMMCRGRNLRKLGKNEFQINSPGRGHANTHQPSHCKHLT